MPKNQATYLADNKYVKSNKWKCKNSPSGAHVYIWEGTDLIGKCRHCGLEHKPAPPLPDSWMRNLNETMRTFNIKRFQAL